MSETAHFRPGAGSERSSASLSTTRSEGHKEYLASIRLSPEEKLLIYAIQDFLPMEAEDEVTLAEYPGFHFKVQRSREELICTIEPPVQDEMLDGLDE